MTDNMFAGKPCSSCDNICFRFVNELPRCEKCSQISDKEYLENSRAKLLAELTRLELLNIDVWGQAKIREDIEAIDDLLGWE